MKLFTHAVLALSACALTTGAAVAQNTTASRCGMTNYAGGSTYTITQPTFTVNQQCFIEVRSKRAWEGGAPDLAASRFVEGNYEVALSGGGGGGGGGGHDASCARCGGQRGSDAGVFKGTLYLAPGVYRVTIGTGGQGGMTEGRGRAGRRGGDGAPTSLSTASEITVAGFKGAENAQAQYAGAAGTVGHGIGGDGGAPGANGAPGGVGFVRITLLDAPTYRPDGVTPPPAPPAPTSTAPSRRRDRN